MGFGIPISEQRLLKDKMVMKNRLCSSYIAKRNYSTCNYKTKSLDCIKCPKCPKCGNYLKNNINIVRSYTYKNKKYQIKQDYHTDQLYICIGGNYVTFDVIAEAKELVDHFNFESDGIKYFNKKFED